MNNIPQISAAALAYLGDSVLELLYNLDAQRTVGVTLTDKYLMLPEKSVSAIVGAD